MSNNPINKQDLKENQCIKQATRILIKVLKQTDQTPSEVSFMPHPYAEANYVFAGELARDRYNACMARPPVAQQGR
jgi:hypothetical protein